MNIDHAKIEEKFKVLNTCVWHTAGVEGIAVIETVTSDGLNKELIILNGKSDPMPMSEYKNDGLAKASLGPAKLLYALDANPSYHMRGDDVIIVKKFGELDTLLVITKDDESVIKTTQESLENFAFEMIKTAKI